MLGAGVNAVLRDFRSGQRVALAADFFQRYLENRWFMRHGTINPAHQAAFDYVERTWQRELSTLKSHPLNLEDVFSILQLDMAETRVSGDLAKLAGLHAVEASLTRMLIEYFGQSYGAHDWTEPDSEGWAFAALARHILETSATVLTFNYDTLLEDALEQASGQLIWYQDPPPEDLRDRARQAMRVRYDGYLTPSDYPDDILELFRRLPSTTSWDRARAYGVDFRLVTSNNPDLSWWPLPSATYNAAFTDKPEPSSMLYKMHGSLNWYRMTGQLAEPRPPESANRSPGVPPEYRGKLYLTRDRPGQADPSPNGTLITKGGYRLDPVLVTPVADKSGLLGPELDQVWKAATEALVSADELVVIGYSFPASDVAARRLVLRAAAAGCLKRITVVDITRQPAEGLRALLGPSSGVEVASETGGLASYMRKTGAGPDGRRPT